MKRFKILYSCEMGLVSEVTAKDVEDARVVAQEMLVSGEFRNSAQLEMVIDSEDVEVLD